ncbi:MAG TPA: vitamin K epoxide reductase family protein, partial [Thermoplasmata archaeon]|nr:vitamin K epoxide reductase family protein [Thermoplasmata archaeon]
MKGIPAETLHAVILFALFVGLLFSAWSGYESLTGSTGSCTLNAFVSCGAVRNSGHTSAYGVPFWAAGVGGFIAMIAVDIPLYVTWRPVFLYALTGLSALGLAISLYFVYLELAVIDA